MQKTISNNLNIIDYFKKNVTKYPNSRALISKSAEITYKELDDYSNQIARYLISRGITKNSIICLYVPRSIDTIACAIAILKIGSAYLPLPGSTPTSFIQNIMDDSKPQAMICENHLHINGINQILVSDIKAELDSYNKNDLNVCIKDSDVAYVTYTSGTTGKPKGVVVSHSSVINLVINQTYVTINSSDMFVHLSPFEFDASTFEIFGAILNGAKLFIMPCGFPTFSEIAQNIVQHRISIIFLTTQLFNCMVDKKLNELHLVRQVLFGGESYSLSHVKKYMSERNNQSLLTHVYGPTECTTFSTYYPIIKVSEKSEIIPIGKPINNVEIIVINKNNEPTSIDEEGELLISGHGLAVGYLNDYALTNEKFTNGNFNNKSKKFFRTGDVVTLLPDGNIKFICRNDRLVKIRGKRVSLDMIEELLKKHPSVENAAVYFVEMNAINKFIHAWVSPMNVPLDNLKEYLKLSVPLYMMPNKIYNIGEIPMNNNRKIDYKKLSENDRYIIQANIKSKLQDFIESVWKKELDLNKIGVDEDFFDLGGHSLILVNVLEEYYKNSSAFPFLSSLTMTNLFEYSTIRSLINFILPHKEE